MAGSATVELVAAFGSAVEEVAGSEAAGVAGAAGEAARGWWAAFGPTVSSTKLSAISPKGTDATENMHGRRYGYSTQNSPPKTDGRLAAGRASSPPMMAPRK